LPPSAHLYGGSRLRRIVRIVLGDDLDLVANDSTLFLLDLVEVHLQGAREQGSERRAVHADWLRRSHSHAWQSRRFELGHDVGESDIVGRVKQLGGLCQFEQDVCL
jgi:hypothetical protein